MSTLPAAIGALALALTACAGETGTIDVALTTAPGSTLLDAVQTLRLTVTNPRKVVMAERTNSGFSLALDLPASGEATSLVVEGFASDGALIANGASPSFPLGAINGRIAIYMAPPLSVAAAPVALAQPRSETAVGSLIYGAIFAGGRVASGAPSDAVTIYNAYDHSLAGGQPLPAPRAGLALAVGSAGGVYLFGGSDESGAATATTWRFDTSVAPAGAYLDIGDKTGFARAGEIAVFIGNERYLITGAPVAELSGLNGSMVAREEVPALPSAGVSVLGDDGMLASIFAGPAGVVRFRNGTFTSLAAPAAARADAEVVALPNGNVAVVCGTTDAVRIDAADGTAETFANIPPVAKTGCAAAATRRYFMIAGGSVGGVVDGTVDVYDATTLAHVMSTSLVVPRRDALAVALPNGQILIASGTDASGQPVGTFELFTPPVE